MTLNDSLVLDNRAEGNGANGNGAGIYNGAGAILTLDNTTVDGRVIDIGNVEGNGGISGVRIPPSPPVSQTRTSAGWNHPRARTQ